MLDAVRQQPRVVSGIIRDSDGHPLENAVIALDPSGATRTTRSNAEGRFRFDNVRSGRHELRATWIGFIPDDRAIEVPVTGLDVEIVLARLPFQLDTLAIVARRTGMLGTAVARNDFRALGGTEVHVLGTQERGRTGNDGRFAFPLLREGAYVIEAKRAGFKTRILPFAVPAGDAVQLVVAMDSITVKADRLSENNFRAMENRLNWRSVPNSAIVSRHELTASRGQPLNLALRYAPSFLHKALILADMECVWVNGKPEPGMLLKDFNADDVAMIEVYGTGGGGGSLADAREFAMLSASRSCGAYGGMASVETGRGQLRYVRRPMQGVVAFVWIWLK